MAWTFNDVRIYVSEYGEKADQIIARLQPLDNKTILHTFGWESETLGLGGLVATTGDLAILKGLIKTGLSYTLSGPEGIIEDYYVSSVKSSRLPIINICLFDRPDLPSTVPVFDVKMELYIDDD